MSDLVRREFLGAIGAGVAGTAIVKKVAAKDESARRTYENDREDGRYMDTVAQLHAQLRSLQPKLAFDPQLKAEDFDAWRSKVREKLLELMCFPEDLLEQPPTKLISAEPRDGYELQRWEVYPEPYSVVPFLVLVPEGVNAASPAPAVMCFPGSTHSKESLAGEPELDTGRPLDWKFWETNRQALHFVKRGFVSVAVENPATAELASSLLPRSYMSQTMLWMGRNYLGVSVFQKAKILEWLSKQPMVDAKRIATCGHSLGSNPADVLGVLYPELVKALIHNDFVCNWHERTVAGNFQPPGGAHHTVPGLFQWFDHTDLEASLAPRPLLFTEGGRMNQIRKIEQAYALLEAKDKLKVYHYEKYAAPEQRPLADKELPEGITAQQYLEYANVDASKHRFRMTRAVPWLADVFEM